MWNFYLRLIFSLKVFFTNSGLKEMFDVLFFPLWENMGKSMLNKFKHYITKCEKNHTAIGKTIKTCNWFESFTVSSVSFSFPIYFPWIFLWYKCKNCNGFIGKLKLMQILSDHDNQFYVRMKTIFHFMHTWHIIHNIYQKSYPSCVHQVYNLISC